MSDLTEVVQWEAGIYQLEEGDPVQAGEGEIDNLQAQQLANRTAWLKQEMEANQTDISDNADAIAGNAAAIVQEVADRQADVADLQQQINNIQPGVSVLYDQPTGSGVGVHNLDSGSFDLYDLLIFTIEHSDEVDTITVTPSIFGLGKEHWRGFSVSGLPSTKFKKGADETSFEVTQKAGSMLGVIRVEGVKN